MVAGDPWMDNVNNPLYFYDGTDSTLAGSFIKQGKVKQDLELKVYLILKIEVVHLQVCI